MKKLSIAASVLFTVVVANAAQWSWSNVYGVNAYNQPGVSGAAASGTMYLICGDTQAAFISSVLGAGSDYASAFSTFVSGSANSATLGSDGTSYSSPAQGSANDGIVTFTGDQTAGSAYKFYQVMLDVENSGVYVSELLTQTALGTGAADLIFQNNGSYNNAAYDKTVTSFQSDGWYTAAVPEPTSGMLLLLGMAGLALKRKRA